MRPVRGRSPSPKCARLSRALARSAREGLWDRRDLICAVPTLHATPRRRGPWLFLAILAFLANGLLLFALNRVLDATRPMRLGASSSSRMEVRLLPKAQEAQEKKPAKQVEGQIVRNDALVEEVEPKDSKRRSEFNNRVKKESKAPNGRPSARAAAAPSQAAARKGAAARKATKKAGAQTPSRPGALLRLDRRGQLSLGERQAPQGEQGSASKSVQGAKVRQRGPSLAANRREMAQLFQKPGTLQDLKDVEEGQLTLLNTKRSRYASFFNRVRDAIARHWHPDVLHRAHDPYGKVYGTKDRTTQVKIVLRADGSVSRVKTVGASGVDYLDDEAVRSIWAAQPFTNPPADLVDGMTGRIEFGFAFTLEIGGRSRIFRMRK